MPTDLRRSADSTRGAAAHAHRLACAERTGTRTRGQQEAAKNMAHATGETKSRQGEASVLA